MSYNVTRINTITPDAQGALAFNMGDLISFTPNDNDVLGFDANGDASTVPSPEGFGVAGSSWQKNAGWGGGSGVTVGSALHWRSASNVYTLDATKIAIPGGTWTSYMTLQAGDYLISMNRPVRAYSSAADYVDFRLHDVTNNVLIGPKVRVGRGRSSSFSVFPISPTSTTNYGWQVVAKGGNPYLPTDTQFQSFSFLVTELP